MATGYVILKLMYHLCITVARYIVETILHHFGVIRKGAVKRHYFNYFLSQTVKVQKKRMELFHYEYQREQQQYQQQRKKMMKNLMLFSEIHEIHSNILPIWRKQRFTNLWNLSLFLWLTNRSTFGITKIHIKTFLPHTNLFQNFAYLEHQHFNIIIGRDMTTSFCSSDIYRMVRFYILTLLEKICVLLVGID